MREKTSPEGEQKSPLDPLTRDLLASLNTTDPNRLRHYWYLAEWKHAIATGKPITQQAFRRANTSTIEQIIETALEQNGLPAAWLARARLPRTARAAVLHVTRTCDPMRPSELERLVRSTHPYLTLNTGDPIDFPRLANENKQFRHETGLSAPDQAPPLEVA